MVDMRPSFVMTI